MDCTPKGNCISFIFLSCLHFLRNKCSCIIMLVHYLIMFAGPLFIISKCWLSNLVSCHLISSLSLNLGGRRGTTDDVAIIPFHPSMSSAAIRESPNSIPVHSLMLYSHLLFCLPLLLAPFTVHCGIVFAIPENLEMWPYHLSFRFCIMV